MIIDLRASTDAAAYALFDPGAVWHVINNPDVDAVVVLHRLPEGADVESMRGGCFGPGYVHENQSSPSGA